MRKLTDTCDEGVKAGLDGREQTYTVEIDDEALWDELGLRALRVKIQAKQRADKPSLTYADVNGQTFKLTEILAKRAMAPMTKEGAIKTYHNESIENKIEMLYDLGLDDDGVISTLAAQLKNGKLTQEDHDLGVELVRMAKE